MSEPAQLLFDMLVRRADDLVVSDRGSRFRSSVVGARIILYLGPPALKKRGEQGQPSGTQIYQAVRSQNVSISYPGR
jgi:hypothetical protein